MESTETFIGTFIHACRYGVIISNQGKHIITDSHGYGIMTELSQELRNYCSNRFLVDFYTTLTMIRRRFFSLFRKQMMFTGIC